MKPRGSSLNTGCFRNIQTNTTFLLRHTLRNLFNDRWHPLENLSNSRDTQKETELSVLRNEITVHIKWVKQATKMHLASLCLDQLHCRDADMVCSKCKTSPWPVDPKTISSEWIALQALWSCIIPSTSRGPLISKIRNLEFVTLIQQHFLALLGHLIWIWLPRRLGQTGPSLFVY